MRKPGYIQIYETKKEEKKKRGQILYFWYIWHCSTSHLRVCYFTAAFWASKKLVWKLPDKRLNIVSEIMHKEMKNITYNSSKLGKPCEKIVIQQVQPTFVISISMVLKAYYLRKKKPQHIVARPPYWEKNLLIFLKLFMSETVVFIEPSTGYVFEDLKSRHILLKQDVCNFLVYLGNLPT